MRRAVLVLTAVILLARAVIAGETYREIALTDGRVLHDAEIKSDQPGSVTILCKEGLLSVAKRSLPPEIAAKHPERLVADTVAPPRLQPPQTNHPPPRRLAGSVSRAGCRIVSMQDRNGAADVALENETDRPIQIPVSDLVCRTSAGQSFTARYLTYVTAGGSLDEPGAPTTMVPGHGRLEVPGRGNLTVRVFFFEPDPNAPKLIERVVWAGAR
jgi:hypothetical protein